MPSLVAVLINAESAKGSPLTKKEVLEIRDGAQAIGMPLHEKIAVADARGYDDVDPENAWEEWQTIRAELNDGER